MNPAKRHPREYITAVLPGGFNVRVALNPGAAIEIGDRNWMKGVCMDRCWFGRGRVITQSYSTWVDDQGRCVGTLYDVITNPSAVLRFCAKAGINPPAWATKG